MVGYYRTTMASSTLRHAVSEWQPVTTYAPTAIAVFLLAAAQTQLREASKSDDLAAIRKRMVAMGEPRVRPCRTPPSRVTSSCSNRIRGPRPKPSRRRANSTVTRSEVLKFSAGGFRDFTRIAASDPTMWRDVFLANKDAVLEMLGRFNEDLSALTRAMRSGDGQTLFDHFARTRAIRSAVVSAINHFYHR